MKRISSVTAIVIFMIMLVIANVLLQMKYDISVLDAVIVSIYPVAILFAISLTDDIADHIYYARKRKRRAISAYNKEQNDRDSFRKNVESKHAEIINALYDAKRVSDIRIESKDNLLRSIEYLTKERERIDEKLVELRGIALKEYNEKT